ncbi:MAG: peroxidase family protein [Cyanophyceae cyanobacterium]
MIEVRTIDGSENNQLNPSWGEANTQLLRLTSPAYQDGHSVPRGGDPSTLPSPRAISNAVAQQPGSITNAINASDWLWQWGQFIDHDLDLITVAEPKEPFNIPVPQGDRFFDPDGTGHQEIPLNRSVSESDADGVRQQLNEITAYIDASMVYGSDEERADFLRANDGTGKLKVSDDNLLPFNTAQLPNDGGDDANLFIAGDVRANEQVGLTAVHTLFVREHNRLAAEIAADPELAQKATAADLSEEDYIYQTARKLVGAQIQAITYNEFLPLLLGNTALEPYDGYDATVNASIGNEFSTAAYRVGHTMLSPNLLRISDDGTDAGSIELKNAFFNPQLIRDEGIDTLLYGLASQPAQAIDPFIVDDVRNFLFGPPGSGGFDLAALNIQRGRDHGLPSYNEVRQGLGLEAVDSFDELTSEPSIAAKLASVYHSVEEVDLWVGGLAEDAVSGSLVGETFQELLVDQFSRLRDGDRFFYLNDSDVRTFAPDIESTTLSQIIQRNTPTGFTIQEQAFLVPELAVEFVDSDGETLEYAVTLSDVSSAIVTVDYRTTAGTATAGEDYTAVSGSLRFDPGETTQIVTVNLSNDSVLNDNATVFLALSNASQQAIAQELAVSRPTVAREISGSAADDFLKGHFGSDSLAGLDGDDRLFGKGDDDFLRGGNGDDTLKGGWGNDTQLGDDGNDQLKGNSGHDTQLGGAGNDTLKGGWGHDTQLGGDGNDQLRGNSGHDTQLGGAGNDTLKGGWGHDTLTGAGALGVGEIDELIGNSGNDTFVLGDADSVFYAGQGIFDYALLSDFRANRDTIQLHGLKENYVLGAAEAGLPKGTGLYLDVDGSQSLTLGTDELIAVSTRTISNFESGFVFV